jgi:lysophospholipase L1-like esterase
MHELRTHSPGARWPGRLTTFARGRLASLLATLTLAVCLAICVSLREGGHLRNTYRELRRELADLHTLMSLETVPCPASAVVLVTAGQSNAANHVGSRLTRDAALPAFAAFRGRCVMIGDPVPGATGTDGSLWTLLAQRLSQELRWPVVIIAGAASGTSVRDWRDDHVGMRSRLERTIRAAVADGLAPDAIVWIQGEADAASGTPADTYASELRETLAALRVAMRQPRAVVAGLKAPLPAAWPPAIVTLTSTCYDTLDGRAGVRTGQISVAGDAGANVRLGPDTDALGDEFRSDGCHFNDAARERIVAELLAGLRGALAIQQSIQHEGVTKNEGIDNACLRSSGTLQLSNGHKDCAKVAEPSRCYYRPPGGKRSRSPSQWRILAGHLDCAIGLPFY